MKLIAAYLLLSLGKESKPTAEDVTKLLSTVGIEADNERLEKLISELDGKDVSELISEGKEKLASVPSGGAVAAAAPAAGAGGDDPADRVPVARARRARAEAARDPAQRAVRVRRGAVAERLRDRHAPGDLAAVGLHQPGGAAAGR